MGEARKAKKEKRREKKEKKEKKKSKKKKAKDSESDEENLSDKHASDVDSGEELFRFFEEDFSITKRMSPNKGLKKSLHLRLGGKVGEELQESDIYMDILRKQ